MKYALWTALLTMLLSSVAFGQRLSVSAKTANIRSGPGTEGYEIVWQVEQYFPIEVLEQKGPWILFQDFEGDKGWINKTLVGDTQTVITLKDKSNVRSGPGPKEDVIFTVEKGVPFKVLEEKGEWIHVEHVDGDKGWLHKSLVW
jgi:SH3-like domain-containing protein